MGYQGRTLGNNQLDNTEVILLDDISSGFNGSSTQFNLTQNGATFQTLSAVAILVKLGGIIQTPNTDYTVSRVSGVDKINFTTAPAANLTCEIRTILGVSVGNVGPDQVRRTSLDLTESSDPTVDLADGDIYYNNSNQRLRLYNGSDSAWTTVYDKNVLNIGTSNVGIGVANPYHKLTVNESFLVSNSTDTADPIREGFLVRVLSSSINNNTDIEQWFVENDAFDHGFRWTFSGSGDNYLRLYAHTQSTTGIEALRFDRATGDAEFLTGNLTISSGAGTNGDCTLVLKADTDNTTETSTPYIIFEQDGGLQYSAIGNGIDTNGNVDDNAIILANSATARGGIVFKTGNTAAGYLNAVERLRITSDGRIGINSNGDPTDIPGTSHDTVVIGNSSAGLGGITIEIASGDNNCGYQFYNGGNQPAARVLYTGNDNALGLWVQANDKASEEVKLEIFDNRVHINEVIKVRRDNTAFPTESAAVEHGVVTAVDRDEWGFVHLDEGGGQRIDTYLNNTSAYARLGVCGGSNIISTGSTAYHYLISYGTGHAQNTEFAMKNAAQGPIAFYTGTTTGSSNSRMEISKEGYFTLSNQPKAFLRKNGTINTVTNSIITWGSTVYSSGGMVVNGSSTRITVPIGGYYMVNVAASGSLNTPDAGDGVRIRLLKNGSLWTGVNDTYPIESTGSASGQEYALNFDFPVPASASDYFEVEFENIGSVNFSMSYGYFSMYLLG